MEDNSFFETHGDLYDENEMLEDNVSDINSQLSQETSTNSPSQSNYKKRAQKSSVWPHFDFAHLTIPENPYAKTARMLFQLVLGFQLYKDTLKDIKLLHQLYVKLPFIFPELIRIMMRNKR